LELHCRQRYWVSRFVSRARPGPLGRHTVRAALHELQQLGFVSRRKNVGTRVESNQPTNDFRPSLASLEDLVQFGARHVREVQTVEKTVATGALARELGCVVGTRWLRISFLRVDKDPHRPPIGWTDVYVDPTYSKIGEIVRASPPTLISSLIEALWPPDRRNPARYPGSDGVENNRTCTAVGVRDSGTEDRASLSRCGGQNVRGVSQRAPRRPFFLSRCG